MTILNIEKLQDVRELSPSKFDHSGKEMMILIHSEMCGHCVEMMPEWDSFEQEVKDDVEFIRKGNTCCIIKIETSQLPELKNTNPSFYNNKVVKMLEAQQYGVPSIATFEPQSDSPKMFQEERTSDKFKQILTKGKSKLGKDQSKKSEKDNKMETKKKAEVEAKKKAEVEAKKKAEVEAKKKAEVEAKKKAEVEAKKKAEVEAKKKAEVEAKKKAEVEAKKKAKELKKELKQLEKTGDKLEKRIEKIRSELTRL